MNLDGSLEKKDNLNKKLFIFGNSYNQIQYPNYAEALLERKKLGINSFITRNCTVSINIRATKGKDIDKACSNLLENYISFFKLNSDKGDSLVITFNHQFVSEYLLNGKTINPNMAIEANILEWKELALDLSKEGKKLAMISQFPLINQDPRLCRYWFTKLNNQCPKGNIFRKNFNKEIELMIRKYETLRKYGVTYINIFSPVEEILKNAPDNKLTYYFTRHHISRKTILLLKNNLREIFFD